DRRTAPQFQGKAVRARFGRSARIAALPDLGPLHSGPSPEEAGFAIVKSLAGMFHPRDLCHCDGAACRKNARSKQEKPLTAISMSIRGNSPPPATTPLSNRYVAPASVRSSTMRWRRLDPFTI